MLKGEREEKHYVLMKDFNTFIYDHKLHRGRQKAFRTVEKLKIHIKNCFKINCKRIIKIPKKSESIRFKNFGKKK